MSVGTSENQFEVAGVAPSKHRLVLTLRIVAGSVRPGLIIVNERTGTEMEVVGIGFVPVGVIALGLRAVSVKLSAGGEAPEVGDTLCSRHDTP